MAAGNAMRTGDVSTITARIALVLLAATVAACGPGEGEASTHDLSQNRTYLASSVPWRDGQDPIESVTVRVEDRRVSLKAGCNEMSTYRASIDNGRLVSESIVGTDMGCSPLLTDQDAWLGNLLGSTPLITIATDRFELQSPSGKLVATVSP
jgi:heat shock protein HslJ